MAMPEDLVLVRHGQSEANIVQKQFRQNPDAIAPEGFFERHDTQMRLSEQGKLQAQRAGEWLLSHFPEGFNRYYVSPLTRTVETAARLAIDGSWRLDDRWRERDWGEFGILNESEQLERFDLSHKLRGQHKWYWCPPGGESLATGVRLRFRDILDTLHRETEGGKVVAVTHGEMIDVARFELERITPDEWLAQSRDPSYRIENCQIMHYSRRNPETDKVEPSLQWMRAVCPWDESLSWNEGTWQEIQPRPKYSDAELLARAEQYPTLLSES